MTRFPEKLALKERAEEDMYFARRDRELIAARRRERQWPLRRILSGGQTGVDRAALDAALDCGPNIGIEAGGWCPRGRWAEDGPIHERYPLRETPDPDPAQRTRWNARDADGTLLLCRGAPSGGTALAEQAAQAADKPMLLIDLAEGRPPEASAGEVLAWLRRERISVLNIAGPRESEAPGIGGQAFGVVRAILLAAAPRAEG